MSFVNDRGGNRYFDDANWKQELTSMFEFLDDKAEFPGSFETDEEYEFRLEFELRESKRQLESKLDKQIDFLSWPGGGVPERGASLAKTAGYRSSTLSSRQQPLARNRPGADPPGIKRVVGNEAMHWRGKWIANGRSSWIMQRILIHQSSRLATLKFGAKKLMWLLGLGHYNRTDPFTSSL